MANFEFKQQILSRSKTWVSALALLTFLATTPAYAQAATPEILIEPQPMETALNQLAQSYGKQIVVYSEDTKGLSASRLEGSFTEAEAFERVLQDSGLVLKYINERTIAIGSEDRFAEPAPASTEAPRFQVAQVVEENAQPVTTAPAQPRSVVADEIIVTAQKRPERYVDVPLSVSTVSSDLLEQTQTGSFQDIVNLSPSVTFSPSADNRGAGILIRGIGTTGFQSGVEPTVSVVVDGVVLGRTGSFLSDLVDVERIEILRGPQSTLFGKNASGGVVNVITKRPSDEFEGKIEGLVAEGGEYNLQGAISGPLSDKVGGRLTAFYKHFDGNGRNVFLDEDILGSESWGLRGKLEFDLGVDTTALLVGDISDMDRNGNTWFARTVNSPIAAADRQTFGITPGPENTSAAIEDISSDQKSSGISLEVNHDFSAVTFTSISAWRNWEIDVDQDTDDVPFTEPTAGHFLLTNNDGFTETSQISQEFRIANSLPATVDYTLGAFFWKQTLDRTFDREVSVCLDLLQGLDTCFAPSVFTGDMQTSVDTENYSVFGQANWHLTDKVSVIGGLRWSRDEISFDFVRNTTNPFPLPTLPVSEAPLSGSNSEDALSGKAGIQYKLTDDSQTYLTYSRGYKAPGVDIVFSTTDERAAPVDAETSNAYELGYKGKLFDNRVILAAALFQTTYDNFQGQAFNEDSGGFSLFSAGSVRTRGAELDLTARLSEHLTLNGGIAYTNAEFKDYPSSPCYRGQSAALGCVGGSQDLSGMPLANSPDWKATLFGKYERSVSDKLNIFTTAGLRWQSEVLSLTNQNPGSVINSYAIVDLGLGVESSDGQWALSAFVKNLTDKNYPARIIQTPFDTGSGTSHFIGRDFNRYAGAKLKVNF